MLFSSLSVLAASLSTAAAASQGFNYGSTKSDGTFNYQSDFESLFTSAKGLVGTNEGFTSARLYTCIQGGSSTNEPIQAFPAAIATGTTLLLGLWASGGQGPFSAELTALKSAIAEYGQDFADLVVGISVGSEDIYRNSAVGKAADAGVGVDALTVSDYIVQLRAVIAGTVLADVPVGHVDTWTGWAQSGDANIQLLIDNSTFIGVDAYPYFQNTEANSISDAKSLFAAALATTESVVGSKEIWITETGWPVSGSTENEGVPSLANAKTYWDEVGCPNFGSVNTWWYTLQDTNPTTPNPSFGVIGSTYTTTPLYDLSCSNVSSSSSSASSTSTKASSSSATAVSASATASSVKSSISSVASVSSSSAFSSVASAFSSAASSGSSIIAAGGSVASSGAGLSPSEGAGNGVNATGVAASTGSYATATAVSGRNGTARTSSSPSSSSTGLTISTGGASALSVSFIGAIGAAFVAIFAL